MNIRTAIVTTSETRWFDRFEFRIRRSWKTAKGVTTEPFEVFFTKLDSVPLKTYSDGDVKPEWSWFEERFTRKLAAQGFNNIVLHISQADKKRLGIKGIGGTYNRDRIPDHIWESLVIADKGQMAKGYDGMPEFVRLMLHEPGHPAAYRTFGEETNIVHEIDRGEGAEGRNEIETLWELFDLSDTPKALPGLLQRLYQLLLELMNKPLYPIDEDYFRLNKISQAFGVRNPHYKSGIHPGTDFLCPVGTEIVAPADGTIVQSGQDHPSLGGHVFFTCVIDGTRYWMRFLHLSKAKPRGQYKKGERLGYTGNTGDSTGPHLHLDVWKRAIDAKLIGTAEGVREHLLDPVAFFKEKVDGIVTQ